MECREVSTGRAEIARSLREDLPDWFGIEAARRDYIRHATRAPMIAAISAGEPRGFVTLDETQGCEIHCMGVRRAHHRCGIGRALVAASAAWARARGHGTLMVKTLCAAHPDPAYTKTRAFYRAVGFHPGEVLTIWGEDLPCQVMRMEICPSDGDQRSRNVSSNRSEA